MYIDYLERKNSTENIWSLSEVKNCLRVSYDYDDKYIQSLIEVAIEGAENYTGLVIQNRNIICSIKDANKNINLKFKPIHKIEAVSLIDAKKMQEDITSKYGECILYDGRILLSDQYVSKDIQVHYAVGTKDNIPGPIKHGILLHIIGLYEYSENPSSMSSILKDLYTPFRMLKI